MLHTFYLLISTCASSFTTPESSSLTVSADTVFLNAKGTVVASRRGATRWRVTEKLPAGGARQQVFDQNGVLRETSNYSDAAATVREGESLYWTPVRMLRCRERYANNELIGQRVSYHSDGTIRRLEVIDHGSVRFEQCFDSDGSPTKCFSNDAQVQAEYKLGADWLASEVRLGTTYPRSELRAATRGQVLVNCRIGQDGRLRTASIARGLSPAFDGEALRVVRSLSRGWQPIVIDGEPMDSFYTVVVDFVPPKP